MSQDKLISLIIRKETYKDVKPYLIDLLNLKEDAPKISSEAVRLILTTDYNAQAKLFAVRYLKDAFQKANPAFIQLTENNLLPILRNIVLDENDEKAVTKYAGSSYTKNEELPKFKSVLSSLFRMSKECLIKWAEWIPDAGRKFIAVLNELKKKNVGVQFQYKYFRIQNQQLFRDNCKKNGIKLQHVAEKEKIGTSVQKVESSKKIKEESKLKERERKQNQLIETVEGKLKLVPNATSQAEIQTIQKQFNEAVNCCFEGITDFKQDLLEKWIQQLQTNKKEVLRKLKASANSKKQIIVPKDNKKQSKTSVEIKKQLEKQKVQAKNDVKQYKQGIKKEAIPTSPKSIKKIDNKQQAAILPIYDKTQANAAAKKIVENKQPKKGPISFNDQEQYEFLPKKQPKADQAVTESNKQSSQPSKQSKQVDNKSKKQTLTVKETEEKKNTKIIDNSVSKLSKDSERVTFSDQQQMSESSEQALQKYNQPKQKKKMKLPSIEEQKSQTDVQSNASPKANMKKSNNNKVLDVSDIIKTTINVQYEKQMNIKVNNLTEENKIFAQKLKTALQQLEDEKKEKIRLARHLRQTEKQLQAHKQNVQKLSKKIKVTVPIQEYNKLRNQLEQQRSKHQQIKTENKKLKGTNQSLIQELNQTKQKLNQTIKEVNQNKQKTKYAQQKVKYNQQILPSNIQNSQSKVSVIHQQRNIISPTISKQQIDQDYIKNLTHHSNIHAWLNQINISLFKKNILTLSDIFYRDDYLTILSNSHVYTQNNQQFLSILLTLQFKGLKQVNPQIKYKNCQELDLWTKPMSGQQMLYKQELAVKLNRNPLKIIKTQLKIIETISLVFLLPCMYFNFLREELFNLQQFDQIFTLKSQQLIKSKIVQWNTQVIKEISDFNKILKTSNITNNKVKFCLSEGINDRIFMGQIQALKNTKFIIRILPIPYQQQMIIKARQLVDNLVFLIS